MSNSTTKAHRSLAVLDLPKRINVLITFADGVVTAMTGNASFPSPSPALAAVSAAITDLQTAETAALARTKGAVSTRNAKRAVLVTMLQSLRMYVQAIADANGENAPAIIQGAGIAVKKTGVRPPRVFAALAGAVSGAVKLVAPSAGRRAFYAWQDSTDGKTWNDLALTLQAKTILTGQTPGTVLQFRYRTVVKTGQTDWSAPVSYVVK
jgi:hypothetical protein